MKRWQIGWLAAVVLAGAVQAAPPAGQKKPAPAGKVKIRPKYVEGRAWRYQLKLSGATAWAPAAKGLQWGKMTTDFTFVLLPKAFRDNGSCTFHLIGEHLRSVGENAEGLFGVDATRQSARAKIKGKWRPNVPTPLAKPMTLTIGPLGAVRFGTGLVPIALFMLPHVDKRFWTTLTAAPLREVGPGDKWQQQLHLPVPGSRGKPLVLKAQWQVLGWRNVKGRRLLAVALTAELDLKDSQVMLRNGDLIHVSSGTYEASGEAAWDVAAGALYSAAANQKILIKADRPTPRVFRSVADCSLKLLKTKSIPPGRKPA